MVYPYAFIDIIIRRDSLERKEKGLSERFIEEHKVTLPHYDDQLICIIGGMNMYDVEACVQMLVSEYGLVFDEKNENGSNTDIVIVDFLLGAITNNNWLKSTGSMFNRQYYFDDKR